MGRREAGERGIVENRGVGNRGNDRTKGFFCEVKRNCPSEREQFELNRLRYYKITRELEKSKGRNGMEWKDKKEGDFIGEKTFNPCVFYKCIRTTSYKCVHLHQGLRSWEDRMSDGS